MRKWFTIPNFEDPYQSFAFRVLHYTLLLLIGLLLIFPVFATSAAQLVFLPVALLVFGTCYYLLHTDRMKLAGSLFLGGFWIIITIAAFSLNGIRNSSLSSYAIVVIYAAILFSDRTVILFTALSVLSGLILVVGEMQGVLPARTTPLYVADRFFQLLALFLSSGILLSAASRIIRRSMAQIRQSERMLLDRNTELNNEIAERRQVEATLIASEEKYRILFENTGVMAVVYDRSGVVVLANAAAARFFGTTPQALQGCSLHALLLPQDAEAAIQWQAQVMDSGVPATGEGVIILPDGREVYYVRNVIPLPPAEADEPVSQVLVITTDLTEHRQIEERKRELAIVQEKNAFLTDFLSTVSHDLKTPLAVMNTSLYLLERIQDPAQHQRKVAQMKEQVDLLDGYIQDMLMISRLEHLPTLNREVLDIRVLIQEVFALLHPRSDKKRITCELICDESLPPVAGDREQVRRLFINLIENAINYTPAGGHVTVAAWQHDDQLLVEVRDTGIGIAPDDIPHIFERFYRAPAARAAESTGTGLGLAIVKKIVELHQGSIEVDSQPGEGTVFRLRLAVDRDMMRV